MGKLGCDNAIADRLKKSDYIPVNSPNQFKLYHYDICRGKNMTNQLQIHQPNPEQPEKNGYYLVPDIDAIQSIDQLCTSMGLGLIHKYRVVCDIMSRHIEIDNSPSALEKAKQHNASINQQASTKAESVD